MFSLGPKGGVQDPYVLKCLDTLTKLIRLHGYTGEPTQKFIECHEETTFVDAISGHMHTFRELAEAFGPLIQGIKFEPKEKDDTKAADWWKDGESEP